MLHLAAAATRCGGGGEGCEELRLLEGMHVREVEVAARAPKVSLRRVGAVWIAAALRPANFLVVDY
jgi:hypothetical protein